tara:strand:- start:1347 stop:1466 length:120 start_codon:yes stop_codon:yes gene_type:complete
MSIDVSAAIDSIAPFIVPLLPIEVRAVAPVKFTATTLLQ